MKKEIIDAMDLLNEFRNRHYNDSETEQRDLAMAINTILPRYAKAAGYTGYTTELSTYPFKSIEQIKDLLTGDSD